MNIQDGILNGISFLTNSGALRCNFEPSTPFALWFLESGGEVEAIELNNGHSGDFPRLCEQIRDSPVVSSVAFGYIIGNLTPVDVQSILVCSGEGKEPSKEITLTLRCLESAAKEVLVPLTELSLTTCTDSISDMISDLSAAQRLRRISLFDNKLSTDGFKALTSDLRLWAQLESVEIRRECIREPEAKILGAAWARAKHCHLRRLVLSTLTIGDAPIAAVVDGLVKCHGLALRSFSVPSCDIHAAGAEKLALLFCQTKLQSIDVSENELGDGTAAGNSLKSCAKSIKELNMECCTMGSRAV